MVWHDAVYDNIQSTPIDSNSSIDIMKVPFIINLSQGPGTRSVKVEIFLLLKLRNREEIILFSTLHPQAYKIDFDKDQNKIKKYRE